MIAHPVGDVWWCIQRILYDLPVPVGDEIQVLLSGPEDKAYSPAFIWKSCRVRGKSEERDDFRTEDFRTGVGLEAKFYLSAVYLQDGHYDLLFDRQIGVDDDY